MSYAAKFVAYKQWILQGCSKVWQIGSPSGCPTSSSDISIPRLLVGTRAPFPWTEKPLHLEALRVHTSSPSPDLEDLQPCTPSYHKLSSQLNRTDGDPRACRSDRANGQVDELRLFGFVSQCTPTTHYLDRCCGRAINTRPSKCTDSCCKPQSNFTRHDDSDVNHGPSSKVEPFRCPDCLRRKSIRTLVEQLHAGADLKEHRVSDELEGDFFPFRRKERKWLASSTQIPEEKNLSLLLLIEDLDSGETFKIVRTIWKKYLKLGRDGFLIWAAQELGKPEALEAEAHIEAMILLLRLKEEELVKKQSRKRTNSQRSWWRRSTSPEEHEDPSISNNRRFSLSLNNIIDEDSFTRCFKAIWQRRTSHAQQNNEQLLRFRCHL